METEFKMPEKIKSLLKELEAVFINCFSGISIVDKHGKILRTNPAMEKLLGLHAEEFVGKYVSELVKEKVFNINVSEIVISTGKQASMLQEISSGAKCLTIGTPVFDNKGEIDLVVINSHDVTELYSIKERLKQTQEIAAGFQFKLANMRHAQIIQENIVFRSKIMFSVLELSKRLAHFDTTVLILGESGVGKELIARLLHRANPFRTDKAYITVNCGTIPHELIEAELFGYEHGAFTGASKEGKIGLFELADGGSIFLDEIGEIPLDLQVKLLRVLQEKEFTKIGASKVKRVDVRIIAASNKNLAELVEQKLFRKDLYYRLNVVPLEVPPLRERKDDIFALANYYVQYFNRKYGLEKILSSELIDVMEHYSWPGNVRELINIIERMIVTSRDNILTATNFPINSNQQTIAVNSIGEFVNYSNNLNKIITEVERLAIINALNKNRTTTEAAKYLCVSRATLNRKMHRYGIKNSNMSHV